MSANLADLGESRRTLEGHENFSRRMEARSS
jgi:hypothetical protein